MDSVYLFYEIPMYWERQHKNIPCLYPDLVVYKNLDKKEELFRWPGFLKPSRKTLSIKAINFMNIEYHVCWGYEYCNV